MKIFRKKPKMASTDFTTSLLPKNRREQFFDILKNRFLTILLLGFLILLFFLPLLIAFVLKDLAIASASNSLTGNELTASINAFKLMFGAIYIPCLMFFSLAIAGSLKIFRRFTYNEPIFIKDDFLIGIKENWKSYFISSFLIGLFTFFATAIQVFFGNQNNMAFIQYLPTGFNLVFIYPFLIQTLFVSTIYDNKYLLNFKLSLHIAIRSVLYLFAFCLILYALSFLRFIPIIFIKYLIYIVCFVVIVPLYLLAFWQSEIHVFDKIINATYYPELFNKGLFNYIEPDKRSY